MHAADWLTFHKDRIFSELSWGCQWWHPLIGYSSCPATAWIPVRKNISINLVLTLEEGPERLGTPMRNGRPWHFSQQNLGTWRLGKRTECLCTPPN
jgi:hypothetical protein